MTKPTDAEAHAALRTFLAWMGEDPDRPGLRDTPDRIMRAWRDTWGSGYQPPSSSILRIFENEGCETPSEMVLVRNIDVFSHCEHHLAPFFGVAHVAYLPSKLGVVGLSKLARVVNHFARRLQVQERLTEQIADCLWHDLVDESTGCGVVIRATHTCMSSRGIHQPGTETVTSALRGAFFTQPQTRMEFLKLAHAI